jgi:opacity protein-like surface antigen
MDGPVNGLGAEYAFTKNVTLGLEWRRIDFGTSDVVTLKTTNSGILTEKLKADHSVDALTAWLNFKF